MVSTKNPPADGAPEELRNAMAWYGAHKQDLLRRYRGEYLAIVDQRVIDHDRTFGALARRMFKRLGHRPVFMPKCVEGERVVRISSPGIARGQ